MDPAINYKREVAYQFMRTLRGICFPLCIVAVVIGGIYMLNVLVNSIGVIQLYLFRLQDMKIPNEMSTLFGTHPVAGYNWYVLKQAILCGIWFTMALFAHAAAIPYNGTPHMPTYKIRHCKHCGAALANSNVYECHECHGKLPSGIVLATIRTYGIAITVVTVIAIWSSILLLMFA